MVHVYWLRKYHINGLVQERCNSIADALELHLNCTNPSIWVTSITHFKPFWCWDWNIPGKSIPWQLIPWLLASPSQQPPVCVSYIDHGSVQCITSISSCDLAKLYMVHIYWLRKYHINGLVQERCNSIADALELLLSCTNSSISVASIIYFKPFWCWDWNIPGKSIPRLLIPWLLASPSQQPPVCVSYIDHGSVQCITSISSCDLA